MDSRSLDQYEERLYSVFKTFDVDNEEALDREAVLALCDALQLEQRGAALVDTLFERRERDRDQRVTFAHFRQGLLTVLADPAAPAPTAAPDPPPPPPPPTHSDEDSSGREVAPKFVFGSKKYGRRSRPCGARPRPVSAPPGPPDPPDPPQLDHSARVDGEQALQLCRRLRMDGVQRRLVERAFGASAELSVGEFFDRLNDTLSSPDEAGGSEGGVTTMGGEDEQEEMVPVEAVVEAWERAGVAGARRLLAELGVTAGGVGGAGVPAGGVQRALEAGGSLRAALVLAGLRRERAEARAADVSAERDRLRTDLDEANRRAHLLAQEVDENHAKLEAELASNLRRAERTHADKLRKLEEERAAERERASAERAELLQEMARRDAAESRLRGEAAAAEGRARGAEVRAGAAAERAGAAERERARLDAALRAHGDKAAAAAAEAARVRDELVAKIEELRAENQRLRDRADELSALLEARPRPAPPAVMPPAPSPAPTTWLEEAAAPALILTSNNLEGESPPVSLEAGPGPGAEAEAATLRAQLADALAQHTHDKQKLEDLVKELESSLEQMREEYERCEEYWSGKLLDERAALELEQRAGDERLAELASKVAEYERQFAAPGRLEAIAEAPALERHAAELERQQLELDTQQRELEAATELLRHRQRQAQRREDELQRVSEELSVRADESGRRAAQLARRERDLARLAATVTAHSRAQGGGGGGGGWCAGGCAEALRARLVRAEAGAARLAARLAAADLLVKDLYVENCRLGPL